jgi:apolipoprotein N-acyltransferase
MITLRKFPASCGLAILSGVIYAFAFPPLGWRFLIIPGLAGLLIALRGHTGTRARTIGFLHGMAAYGVGLSWLYHIFGSLVPVMWCVLAAFTALFAEMQSRASNRGITGWYFAAFTAINWSAWEFIRAELFPLKFPWMTPGLAIGPNALLPWIGVYGVGVALVLAIALLVSRKWLPSLVAFGIIATAAWFQMPISQSDAHIKVAGLQFENVALDTFLHETRALPADIDLVVWPEYAIPYDIRKNTRDWKLIRNLCKERNLTLTFGTQLAEETSGDWRNIALTLDPTGICGEHTKVHTVHFFDDGTPGTTSTPVATSLGHIGTPVCFDCDYQDVVRGMTQNGAQLFIVPIMDALSWTAKQQEQHAELFRIRACENARWMFVCASSGVSQIIDPTGRVHGRLESGKQEALIGTIHPRNGLTFFTRFGWFTPWLTLSAAAITWIAIIIPRRNPARQ